jgi:uncharacterized protein
MPHATPVSAGAGQRIETLDVLRGFALLGILAMNIRAMAAPFSAYMYPYAMFAFEGLNRTAYWFTAVFFDLKMMGLFSMLFGAGVLLYAAKSTQTGSAPTGLWFRRMFWLLVIGLVHAYFIWDGDILVPYALCGLLLLWWMRNRSARTLAITAVVVLVAGGVLGLGQIGMWENMSEADRAEALAVWMPSPEQMAEHKAEMLGSYWHIVSHRAMFVFMGQTMYFALFFFWRCGGMMLLGMALYKSGFLDARLAERTYARTALITLPIGIGLSWYGFTQLEAVRFAYPDRAVPDVWNYFGAVFTSIGYASVIILAVKKRLLTDLRSRLAAVGQMAFSNYLSHSIVTSVLFLGWGLGLANRYDYAEQLGWVLGIWIVQLLISPIWLRTFRFGPAEWLWRSLTYWTRQPMRR